MHDFICIVLCYIQILGFIFGATNWLRNLIIGENAPLRVIQDSVKLLGYELACELLGYGNMHHDFN